MRGTPGFEPQLGNVLPTGPDIPHTDAPVTRANAHAEVDTLPEITLDYTLRPSRASSYTSLAARAAVRAAAEGIDDNQQNAVPEEAQPAPTTPPEKRVPTAAAGGGGDKPPDETPPTAFAEPPAEGEGGPKETSTESQSDPQLSDTPKQPPAASPEVSQATTAESKEPAQPSGIQTYPDWRDVGRDVRQMIDATDEMQTEIAQNMGMPVWHLRTLIYNRNMVSAKVLQNILTGLGVDEEKTAAQIALYETGRGMSTVRSELIGAHNTLAEYGVDTRSILRQEPIAGSSIDALLVDPLLNEAQIARMTGLTMPQVWHLREAVRDSLQTHVEAIVPVQVQETPERSAWQQVGTDLNARRKELAITVDDLAARAGVSHGAVEEVMYGMKPRKPEILRAMMRELGYSSDETQVALQRYEASVASHVDEASARAATPEDTKDTELPAWQQIGRQANDRRKQEGLRLQDVSRITGIGLSTIESLLYGQKSVSSELATNILNAIGYTSKEVAQTISYYENALQQEGMSRRMPKPAAETPPAPIVLPTLRVTTADEFKATLRTQLEEHGLNPRILLERGVEPRDVAISLAPTPIYDPDAVARVVVASGVQPNDVARAVRTYQQSFADVPAQRSDIGAKIAAMPASLASRGVNPAEVLNQSQMLMYRMLTDPRISQDAIAAQLHLPPVQLDVIAKTLLRLLGH